MTITVSNKITIEHPTQDVLLWCKQNLEVANPEYTKKKNMGFYVGNIPRTICLYEKIGDALVLPFGMLKDLFSNFKDAEYIAQFHPTTHINYKSNIKPYPYQEQAINEAMKSKNGVIVMPCGAGKTNCGLELIARLGYRALWLTHTHDLLTQSMARAKSVLDIPCKSYGTITGGKVNIGDGITFATVQTMSRLDLTQYKDTFDIVIVDECHKAVGSPTKAMQFYKVLSSLNARYKYGLTATPRRSDGLEKSMFALLGNVCTIVEREKVKHTTSPVKIEYVYSDYVPNDEIALAGDGTLNYTGLVEDLTHDVTRFDLVLDTINDKKQMLVLANRVEYLDRLSKAYCGTSVCLSALGNSKSAKETRRKVLAELNAGELDCVFATYQLAKEGLDCPNLRYVVFATPEKDETTIEQSVGRVGRRAEGKEYGTVIDFVDSFGLYKGWKKKREKIYKKLECEVI